MQSANSTSEHRRGARGLALTAAILALGTVGTPAVAEEEFPRLQLRSAQGLSAGGFASQTHQWWADEIGRRTNGRVTIETFWGGSLVAYRDTPAAIAAGAVDLGQVPSTYDPARTRLWMTLDMPLNFRDHYCGVTAVRRIAHENEDLAAELERNNMMPVVGYNSGWFQFMSRDPLASLDDLRGQRMRSYGGARVPFAEELGITPVFMPFPDIYPAIDRGVIDGAEVVGYLVEVFSLQEVAPNLLIANSGAAVAAPLAVFNRELWFDMPENLRDLITEVSIEHDERFSRRLMEEEARTLKMFEDDPNVTVRTLSEEETRKLEEAAARVHAKWIGDAEAAGLPAQKLWDQFQSMQRECEADVAANGYPWER